MEKPIGDKRIAIFSTALVVSVLVILSAVYFQFYFQPYAGKGWADISDNWVWYTDADTSPHPMSYLKKVKEIQPGETMYLTRLLEEETAASALLVKYCYQRMTVRLDGEILAESPIPSKGKNPGAGLLLVTLTEEDRGKQITLEITSPYALYAGEPQPVFLGKPLSLQAKVFTEAFPHIVFLITCTVLGFLFLFYAVLAAVRGRSQWHAFFFGLFSVLLGFFCISRDDLIYLLFPPVLASSIAIILHTVYLIPLLAYLNCYFTVWKRLARFLLTIFFTGSSVMLMLWALNCFDLPELIPAVNVMLGIVFLPIIGIMLYEVIRGNRTIRFLFPIISLVVLFSAGTGVFYHDNQSAAVPLYLAAVFLLVVNIWVFHLREFIRLRSSEKRDLQMLRFHSELAHKNYENMLAHIEETRMIRHEINHHVAALKILNDQGEKERISEYLDGIIARVNHTTALYSENVLINCLISDAAGHAVSEGIQFSHTIQVPSNLLMEDPDLCSLLSNLLDNAIEGCRRIPPEKERWIEIKIKYNGRLLLISCRNTCLEQGGDRQGFPTEKEGEQHGYGLRVMRSIAAKYGGPFDVSRENGVFTVRTVLNLAVGYTSCSKG